MNHLECTMMIKGVEYELYRSSNFRVHSKNRDEEFPLIRKFNFRSVERCCPCCDNILPEYTVEIVKTGQ